MPLEEPNEERFGRRERRQPTLIEFALVRAQSAPCAQKTAPEAAPPWTQIKMINCGSINEERWNSLLAANSPSVSGWLHQDVHFSTFLWDLISRGPGELRSCLSLFANRKQNNDNKKTQRKETLSDAIAKMSREIAQQNN